MNLHYECVICQMKAEMKLIEQVKGNEERLAFFNEASAIISGADKRYAISSIFEDLGRLNARYGFPQADYAPLKKYFNDLMLSVLPRLREEVWRSRDPLAEALKFSRAGNYIDFGAFDKIEDEQLMALLERARGEALDEAEYARLLDDLSRARTLTYLLDNCGEVVLDGLVLEVLKKSYPSLELTAVARGGAVLNDATVEDALYAGLDKVARVTHNGSSLPGNQPELISEEAKKLIAGSDVVIAKGMGNFETMCRCGYNIYYLFLCKCDFFARRLGVELMTGMLVNERRLALHGE